MVQNTLSLRFKLLKALLASYWVGTFLLSTGILYLLISLLLHGRFVFSLAVVLACSFLSSFTFRLSYSFVEVYLEKMFGRAKCLILLSGFTSALIAVLIIVVYPWEILLTSLNLFFNYLLEIVPFVIFMLIGLLSGFLLARFSSLKRKSKGLEITINI